MKYNFIFFISIIILTQSCSGKITKKKAIVNVEKYNKFIDSAELNILNKKYVEALGYYFEAENNIGIPMAFDMNNALITTVHLEDWDNAIYWSKKIISKGINPSFFEKKIFNKLKSTNEWGKFNKEINIYYENFEKTKNKVLIDSLRILNKIDQQQYCLIPSGKIDLSDAFSKTVFIDSLLSRLIKNRGFPSEEKIGVSISNGNTIDPLPIFFSLLRHSYQSNSNLLENDYKNAVEKGLLSQEVYNNLFLMDKSNYLAIDCKIYKSKFISNKDEFQNNLLEKKILYTNMPSDSEFVFFAPLSIMKDSSEEVFGKDLDFLYSYLTDYTPCEK